MFSRPHGIRFHLANIRMRFSDIALFKISTWPGRFLNRSWFLNRSSGRSKTSNVANRSGNGSTRKEKDGNQKRLQVGKAETEKRGAIPRAFDI